MNIIETQLDNKINFLEKNKVHIDSLKNNLKEFIKAISIVNLKNTTKIEKLNAECFFTEEVNRIALSSNNV